MVLNIHYSRDRQLHLGILISVPVFTDNFTLEQCLVIFQKVGEQRLVKRMPTVQRNIFLPGKQLLIQLTL